MKIIIKEIDGDTIYYSTQYGQSKAEWIGEMPLEMKEYFVEIELEDLFSENSNMIKSDIPVCEMVILDEKTVFTGVLEAIESDGYAVLRMGENVIPFEIKQGLFTIGDYVSLLATKVSIYPCDY